MSNRNFILFFFIIFGACNSSTVSEIESKDSIEKDSIVSIRNFDSKDLLFLSFYRGMNKLEFNNALEVLQRSKKVGIRKRNDDFIKENGTITSPFLNSNWIDYNAVIKDDQEYIGPFSSILYKMTVGEKEYYAELLPIFNVFNELIRISLKVPTFATTPKTMNPNDEIIRLTQTAKQDIIDLYTSKYGSPKTQKKEFKGVAPSLLAEHGIKPYNLIFIDKKRIISIFPSCCISFEPTITYELISDFENKRSDLIRNKKQENPIIDSLSKITFKEI